MKKYFIFTVDTEGDNLWAWKEGKSITTENSKCLPKFQELCDVCGIKPVYLTNYEMLLDTGCVNFLKQSHLTAKCEIGMHIHAWNTPPHYELNNVYGGNAYITEYPYDIMKSKADFLKSKLEEVFETDIISHRSGRWATDERYLHVLKEIGIKVDCSYTPGLDLSHIPGYSQKNGNDYRNVPMSVFQPIEGLYEVPMTTRRIRSWGSGTLKHRIKTFLFGKDVWCRPIDRSVDFLCQLERSVAKEAECNHIEMMIHSSELMPGGSPYFKTAEDIQALYDTMKAFFEYILEKGYIPVTFKEYLKIH